jgi:type I restriction enzyme S subunit
MKGYPKVSVSKLGSLKKGGAILREKLRPDGAAVCLYGDIYTKYAEVVTSFISRVEPSAVTDGVRINTGDVVFAGSGETAEEIGKCIAYVGNEEAYAGGDVVILSSHGQDARYLGYVLNAEDAVRQKMRLGQGSSVMHLYKDDVGSIKIPLPPLAEQRKIAEILRTWDEAIEIAEAELKAKQERKRWLMDRLFKFSPESHLEQVKMQDAVDVLKGDQLNRHTLAEKGSCPVWNGGITPSGYTESFNTEGPAVIMSEGGNSCGAITRVNENFWRGGHCYHVVPRDGFSNDYIFAALKYYEPQIMRLRVGSGLPNIQKKTFLSWAAPLHKPAYRDKVASVFTHAQLEGELANKHIETLRTQKRGLMQKLLTGEVQVAA